MYADFEMDDILTGDEDGDWVLEKAGLKNFVKEQPYGLKTMLYPEGQQIPYVISKKIVLARSIVRKPRLLILKDPLDQFDTEETREIMDFLSGKTRPWALVVISQNDDWKKHYR